MAVLRAVRGVRLCSPVFLLHLTFSHINSTDNNLLVRCSLTQSPTFVPAREPAFPSGVGNGYVFHRHKTKEKNTLSLLREITDDSIANKSSSFLFRQYLDLRFIGYFIAEKLNVKVGLEVPPGHRQYVSFLCCSFVNQSLISLSPAQWQ